MQERLIFTSEVERKATLELITENFPNVRIWEVPDPDFEVAVYDMELELDKEYFFEWAVLPNQHGRPVILYCLNLTMELLAMPPWVKNIFNKLKYADGKNLLDDENTSA